MDQQDQDIIKILENAHSAPDDPLLLFGQWMKEAEASEPADPNAMCLATIDPDGKPDARIVLLKQWDERGFVFYTNRESRKGRALAAHPVACLNFHWKTLGRQVRINGAAEQVSAEESDAYYATRPVGSRIGAWASRQSRPLESRSALAALVKEFEEKYKNSDHIPRPPHWGGYRIKPERIEFWHDGDFRLHTRLVYQRAGTGWEKEMLFP